MVLSHQELRPGNHCLQHHVGNNVVVKKQELKTNLNVLIMVMVMVVVVVVQECLRSLWSA